MLPTDGEEDRLVWNPHAGDSEVIATLKNLVQAMAAATGREGRLAWVDATLPTTPRLSFCRDVLGFGARPDHRYASLIACYRSEAIVEARVLQSALSVRCGRRVAR